MKNKKKKFLPKQSDPIRSIWCPQCKIKGGTEGAYIETLEYDGEFVLLGCQDCGHMWWSDQKYAFVLWNLRNGN